jgi:hypothetical protein
MAYNVPSSIGSWVRRRRVAPLAGPLVPSPSGVPTVQPSQGPAARGFSDYLGQARSLYNPALAASAEAINRRTELGMGAIGQYTGQLVGMAGQYAGQVRQAYQPQIDLGRGVAGWAQSALVGAGKAGQGDLNAALAQSGFAPSAGPRDINLKQQGKGAGGAAYGTGMADVDALVAAQAASAARAAQEPTWAAGLGEQAKTLLAVQSARALADQQAALEAQIPGLALDLRSQDISQAQDLRDYQLRLKEFQAQQAAARTQQAQARAQITGRYAPTLAGRQAYWDKMAADKTAATGTLYRGTTSGIAPVLDPRTKRPVLTPEERRTRLDAIMATYYTKTGLSPEGVRKAAALGYDLGTGTTATAAARTGTAAPVRLQHYRGADGKMYAFNPVTGQTSAIPGGAPPKANLPKVDLRVSQNLGKWVDSSGNPIPGLNKPGVPPPKPTGTRGGGGNGKLTPGQLDTMVKNWYTGTTARKNVGTAALPNWQDVPTGQGKIGYQQAYSNLRNRGYNDLEARTALDIYWKRGEAGRPWLPGAARTTLTKANLRPTPRFHPYTGKDAKTGKPYTAAIPYLTPAQVKALKAAGQLPPGEWADRPPEGHVWVIHSQ